jgi:hypothetical protein
MNSETFGSKYLKVMGRFSPKGEETTLFVITFETITIETLDW